MTDIEINGRRTNWTKADWEYVDLLIKNKIKEIFKKINEFKAIGNWYYLWKAIDKLKKKYLK